jgi:hypothetical protein
MNCAIVALAVFATLLLIILMPERKLKIILKIFLEFNKARK